MSNIGPFVATGAASVVIPEQSHAQRRRELGFAYVILINVRDALVKLGWHADPRLACVP